MPKDKEEQLFFDFGTPDGSEKKKQADSEEASLFETEDDALSALIDKDGKTEWVPCDPSSSEDDGMAVKWLSDGEASTQAEFVSYREDVTEEILINDIETPSGEPIPDGVFSSERAGKKKKNASKRNSFTPASMRQAVLGWLAMQNPSGLALKVATTMPHYTADAAAFWLTPKLRNSAEIERTAIVEICLDEKKCQEDYSKRKALQKKLADLLERKTVLEEKIRESEPGLMNNSLFEETREWDYASSKNQTYQRLLKRIGKTEFDLSHVNRFARITAEELADEYYLAAPENLIREDQIPHGWGLIYISETLQATVVRNAKKYECPRENRENLALKAAASGMYETLFTHGISISKQGGTLFHTPPKKRRPLKFT